MMTPTNSYFTRFYSELIVPPLNLPHNPDNSTTIDLWPGLQPTPDSLNYEPIDHGLLFSQLTWGSSCTPGHQPEPYSSWWISGMYYNEITDTPLRGCFGGGIMNVKTGERLNIDIWLEGDGSTKGIWHQDIVNNSTGKSANYLIDMKGQGQNWADLVWEFFNYLPTNVTFIYQNINLTVAKDYFGYCVGKAKMRTCVCTHFKKNGLTCQLDECRCDLSLPTIKGISNISSIVSQHTSMLQKMIKG